MKRLSLALIGAVALLATGCDRLATTAVSVKAHEFPQHGVICYTYNTNLSCVKVVP